MNLKFPAWYSFHLQRDVSTGRIDITATDEKTKSDARNRKFRDLKRFSWDGKTQFAVIEVTEIKSEDELKDAFKRLHDNWIAQE